MVEGRAYYMEGLYRETSGITHMAVAFQQPGDELIHVASYKYLKKY